MFKQSLIILVFLIVIYQIFLNYTSESISSQSEDSTDNEDRSNTMHRTINRKTSKQNDEIASQSIQSKHVKKEMIQKSNQKITSNKHYNKIDSNSGSVGNSNLIIHPVYGKPSMKTEIGFKYTEKIPSPWIFIIFNPNNNPNHHYAISLLPLTKYVHANHIITTVSKWDEYLKLNRIEILFNNNNLELLIPSQDEEFALTVCNLMINTIIGNLTIEGISNNNLIQVSLNKIKNYPMIKNKIVEQIKENMEEREKFSSDTNNSDEDMLDYKEDLATSEAFDRSEINTMERNNTIESMNGLNGMQSNQSNDSEESEIEAFNRSNLPDQPKNNELIAFEQSGNSSFSFI